MRELILSAALKLFVEESFEGTTMRRIADEIEYTPGAIYSYFKDKDEICYALHTRGFEMLGAMMNEALAKVGKRVDPIERLRVIGQTYIRFALDNPSLYDLMFLSRQTGKKIVEKQEWEPGMGAFATLREVVQMIVTKHQLDWDVDALTFLCWSHVHGAVSLVVCDRCAPLANVPQADLIQGATDRFLAMLKLAAKKGA